MFIYRLQVSDCTEAAFPHTQVKDEVYVYSKEGKELERLAPDFIGSMYVSRRQKQTWLFVSMTGFTTPGMSGRYDFTAPEGQRWSWYSKTKVSGLNPDEFEAQQVSHRVPHPEFLWLWWRLGVASYGMYSFLPLRSPMKQVWYPSKDGTKVPMFIVRHKDTPFDGTAPVYQYGGYPLPSPLAWISRVLGG